MFDAQDDITLVPSDVDRLRLEDLAVDGRMESENGTWIVLRYPENPHKGWQWCAYTLIVNHPKLRPVMAEMKNVNALLAYLSQLEGQRPKNHG